MPYVTHAKNKRLQIKDDVSNELFLCHFIYFFFDTFKQKR